MKRKHQIRIYKLDWRPLKCKQQPVVYSGLFALRGSLKIVCDALMFFYIFRTETNTVSAKTK